MGIKFSNRCYLWRHWWRRKTCIPLNRDKKRIFRRDISNRRFEVTTVYYGRSRHPRWFRGSENRSGGGWAGSGMKGIRILPRSTHPHHRWVKRHRKTWLACRQTNYLTPDCISHLPFPPSKEGGRGVGKSTSRFSLKFAKQFNELIERLWKMYFLYADYVGFENTCRADYVGFYPD